MQAQLNAWEQANISLAIEWLQRRRKSHPVLDVRFLRELHRRMFNRTWRWAGQFRTTGKNIGVAAPLIAESLGILLADTTFWLAHHSYPLDEIAARFHHRLVSIHSFPNGNGRHARLATDSLLASVGAPPFTWGSAELVIPSGARDRYLQALKEADAGSFEALLAFARS